MSKKVDLKHQVFSYCDELIDNGMDIKDITISTLVEKFPEENKKTLSNILSKYKKGINSNIQKEGIPIKDIGNGNTTDTEREVNNNDVQNNKGNDMHSKEYNENGNSNIEDTDKQTQEVSNSNIPEDKEISSTKDSNVNIVDTNKQTGKVGNGNNKTTEIISTEDVNVSIVDKENMTGLNGNVNKDIDNIFDRLDIITKILEKQETGDTSLPEIDYSEYKHFKDYKYSLSEELHSDFVFYAKNHGLSNRKAVHIALKLFCDVCKGLNK